MNFDIHIERTHSGRFRVVEKRGNGFTVLGDYSTELEAYLLAAKE
jgi:hypothetical protein